MHDSSLKKYQRDACVRPGHRGAGVLSVALTGLTVAIILLAVMSGCGSETATISSSAPATAEQLAPTPVLTEDYVRLVAENRQGNAMVVREAVISGDGSEQAVEISVDRPSGLQDGSVAGVMASYGQHVFTSLFQIPEVASVTITMYGVQQGVESDDVAMRIMLDRAGAGEAEWSMFGPMTIADMVTEYYVDPAIEENSYS